MRPARPAIVLVVVGFGVFVAADDLTVATTMLRAIIADLEIPLPEGFGRAAWIVNAYLVAYVAVMPIAGRLSDLWGRRRVFVGSLALFAIGSAIIPFTSSLGPFLVGRVLTALGGGAMVPVALAAVSDVFPADRRGRALGALGALETLGWVWGPLFGALLVRFLDWRWQFYANVPLALIGMAFAWVVLRGVGERVSGRRLDLAGALTGTVALVALTVALVESGDIATAAELAGLDQGGGLPIWPLLLIAVGAGVGFVLAERRSSDPLMDPAMIGSRAIAPALATNLLVGVVLAVAMVNTPLFVNLVVENTLARAAVSSGWVLTALTAAMAATAPLGGLLTDRASPRIPAVGGLAVATAAFTLMGSWDTGTSAVGMAIHLGVLGIGFGLLTAPLGSVVITAVPPAERGVAAATVLIARLVGLAIGLAGITAWALHRYDTLRRALVLPPITDPGYADAADAAQRTMSATVLSETFLLCAGVAAIAVLIALLLPGKVRE